MSIPLMFSDLSVQSLNFRKLNFTKTQENTKFETRQTTEIQKRNPFEEICNFFKMTTDYYINGG